MDFFRQLFSSDVFMPHGHCYLWAPEILWTHVLSDGLVAASYFSIPVALVYFVRRREDMVFPTIFYLFGAFIFLCGLTHVMDIWTTWNPTYRAEALLKAMTAGVSVATAVVLWPLIPKALAIPSPTQLADANAKLAQLNEHLEAEIERRQAAEAELRKKQSIFDAVLGHAPAAIYMRDLEGRYQLANKKLEEFTGVPADQIIGRRSSEWMPGALVLSTEERDAHTLETRDPIEFDVEAPLATANGDLHTFRVLEFPLADPGGVAFGVGGIGIDVSERRVAEIALAERTEQLELKSAELGRSNDALEHFAYAASHDLQEPLRMVASFLELIERNYQDELDERGERWIRFAVDGARRMQMLVRDLLTYSRAGRAGAEKSADDTGAVMAEVLDLLQQAREESGARITWDADLPVLAGSRAALRELLQNLVGNALKYRGADAPEVHVSVALDGGAYHFQVRDNGIGFDPEFADRIFQVFQRLHSREDYAGTGIGLPICRRLVEAAGGRIWADSTPGEGSVFHFTWPADEPEPGADENGEA